MIIIKEIEWSNWFSYGANNKLVLDSEKLTQIVGSNGNGKSSIPVILGEVLYGKNNKGIKKEELANRVLPSANLTAKVVFCKTDEFEDKFYTVTLNRGSKLSLTLLEDGKDISSHTTKDTYASIEKILGMDFKLFSQLTYQSSTESLQFLTATDTNRKKFLINLFNLEDYLQYHELFKSLVKQRETKINMAKGSIEQLNSWIASHSKKDLISMEEVELPEPYDTTSLSILRSSLSNIDSENQKIKANNALVTKAAQAKEEISKLRIPEPFVDTTKEKAEEAVLESKIKEHKALVAKWKTLNVHQNCPTCGSEIAKEDLAKLIDTLNSNIAEYTNQSAALNHFINANNIKQSANAQYTKKLSEYKTTIAKAEGLVYSKEVDINELHSKIQQEVSNQMEIDSKRKKAEEHNKNAAKHNAEITFILQKLEEYKDEVHKLEHQLDDLNSDINSLSILKDAFSTNGLLSYKLEFLIKDLEHQINEYLSVLSSGRFTLSFTLSGEKLDIVIDDNGKTTTVEALSAGELARVNTASLLAIRRLMSAISNTNINILFLDEVMGVLDDSGKEKLVEVLLQNDSLLNTFLVSHEWSHPLVPQIHVIKENNISRIENG